MNDSPDTPSTNLIKQGDILRLGEHLLVCDDASTIDLGSLIDAPIDLVLTDPPYAIDYVESKRGLGRVSVDKDIQNDGIMSEREYVTFTKSWLSRVLPRLTPKNSIYVFNSDRMIFALRESMAELGIKPAQLLIWVKSQPVVGRLDYLPQHELIIYGWYGKHTFHRSKDKSVLFAPKPSKSVLHPTMKPVSLLRRLILNGSAINGLVYDPFGGSGSTLIACEQTKRKCLMVEIDPHYCATIVQRWRTITGYDPELINQR